MFLYTYGVTEAQNNKEKIFGEERLLNAINNIDLNEKSESIVNHIIDNIDEYVDKYPQSDDITMLCVKRI